MPTLPSGKSTIVSFRPGNSGCKSSDMPYSEVKSSSAYLSYLYYVLDNHASLDACHVSSTNLLDGSRLRGRYCLNGELSFRGHDEKVTSLYKGNYLELVKLIGMVDKNIDAMFKRAPKNCQLLSLKIQKEIATCFEVEVLEIIFKEIGDDVFSLLVDESSDVTKKEQMAIVFRYVNKNGLVKESLFGIIKVKKTSSAYLKSSIDTFFAKNHLSLKQLSCQGYDGASNMRVEFIDLKAKILEENNSTYYVHCFAYQLQLVVVAVTRKRLGVVKFFDKLSLLTKVVFKVVQEVSLHRATT
ncbi:zinc finger MYM-type protein 1-like protein [Tanacetum coccineum]